MAQNKFLFTQAQFQKFYSSMKVKIPEIEKATELIRQLSTGEGPIQTQFQLTEGINVEAEAERNNKVYLWLGANTMVEYNFKEALELLEKNLSNAKKNSETYKQDLEFIRDQLTILEVNYARVHNYKVELSKQKK